MNSIISAFKGLKRNFSMASASIILVLLTLLVMGSVVIVGLNANKISKQIIDSISIYAYLDKDLPQEQIENIQDEVKSIDKVDEVAYSSPDQEFQKLLAYFGDDAEEMEKNFSGDDNPLYPVLEISIDQSVEQLSPIVDQIGSIEGIEKVNEVSSKSLEKLVSLIRGAQIVGIILAALLFAVSLFIITNTIRLAISSRRKEIEIMRLVGATKNYIRAPFIVEGFIIGLVGGLISASILTLTYYQLYGSPLLKAYIVHIVNPNIMAQALYIVLIAAGVIIGMSGSIIALRRHLKR